MQARVGGPRARDVVVEGQWLSFSHVGQCRVRTGGTYKTVLPEHGNNNT